MSGFLEDIVAATEGAPLRAVEVPEWGRTVHWRPASLARREQIQKRAAGSDSRACAVALMLLALDEKGQPLFEDNAEVMARIESDLDGTVVARVVGEMLGAKVEGNPSRATRT